MMLDAESIERAGRFFLSFDKADATKVLGGCTKLISFLTKRSLRKTTLMGKSL
jgi:hypothetical protein